MCLHEIVVWVSVLCWHLMPSLHISSLLPGMLPACQKMSVLILTAVFLAQVTFAAHVLLQISAVYCHCAGRIKALGFLYLCFPLVCGFVWSALCWWPSAPPTLRHFHVCWILVAEHTLTELSVTSCSSFLSASAFRFSLHLCQCWDFHTDMEVWVLFFSGL